MSVAFPAGMGMFMYGRSATDRPGLWPYVAVAGMAWAASREAGMLVAWDGAAFWSLGLASRARPILLGKQVGLAALVLPPTIIGVVAASIWRAQIGAIVPAIALTLALFALWMGVGAVRSTRVVFAVPRDVKRRGGRRAAGWSSIGYLIGGGTASVILVEIVVREVVFGSTFASATVAISLGAGAWCRGVRYGAARLDARSMEIIATLSS